MVLQATEKGVVEGRGGSIIEEEDEEKKKQRKLRSDRHLKMGVEN